MTKDKSIEEKQIKSAIKLMKLAKDSQKEKDFKLFREMINKRIKEYKKLHKMFPKDLSSLRKWEAMVELLVALK